MITVVLGAGVSGRAAAGLARRLGHRVVGFDQDERAAARAREAGLPFRNGWDAAALEGADLVVTSPGIGEYTPMITDVLQAGVPLWSELEFGARHCPARLLAVTGTNGKTSAVTAATAMLEASGAKVCAAGNIGTALSEVAQEAWDAIVVEASSFQLRFTESFHPAGAVILNVTPDHLDWHGSFGAYLEAKRLISANQGPGDLLAYGVDDAGARAAVSGAAARLLPISGERVPPDGAGVADGEIRVDGLAFRAPDLGADLLVDLVAAAVLARHGEASAEGIRAGLEGFRPGPHRRNTIGSWDGVAWVDDSKATNPHAAVAAAAAYESVILIAGGRNKGLDLSPMAEMPSVRHVITLGEAAPELDALIEPAQVTRVESLDEAVVVADERARPGDTVLLAPGCASFDMFESYAQRGRAFRDAVVQRKAGG